MQLNPLIENISAQLSAGTEPGESRLEVEIRESYLDGSNAENTNSSFDPNTLVSAGLELRLQLEDNLSARFDWGIPLVSVSGDKDSLQENGLYFSIITNPF